MLASEGSRTGNLLGRYYDPATGQFLTVDPLVDETEQAYSYAGNDPVDDIDPTGASVAGCAAGVVLGGGVGAALGGCSTAAPVRRPTAFTPSSRSSDHTVIINARRAADSPAATL